MSAADRPMPRLSVFFFSSADMGRASEPYRFFLETADLAERLGFEAAWIPERHFHQFGGLFPNPSVLAAALAVRTRRIALRAGSVVLPLHHVARVAEEWAVVDALSGGRVGLSLATGWNRADFALASGDFARRREQTYDTIDVLRALWRGDEVSFPVGDTAVSVRTYPTPAQESLPLWLTATSGSATFLEAGRRGLRVLTAFVQQTPRQMEDNIRAYRAAFVPAEPHAEPHVTLMVHAYVADTRAEALAVVEEPLLTYQGQFLDLDKRGHAPAGDDVLSDEERQELARYSVRRYATECGAIGGEAEVAERLRYLSGIGVDEVACLVDFGLKPPDIFRTLRRLADIVRDAGAGSAGADADPALASTHARADPHS